MLFILLLLVPLLSVQDPPGTEMVLYSPDYEFRDGIYLNSDMLKSNRPIPPSRVISDRESFDRRFYEDLMKKELIALSNDQGVREYLKPGQLWGYVCKGELYLQLGNSFQKLILEGNISRFMASATTYDERTTKQFDSGAYPSRYYYRPYGRRPGYSYATMARGEYLLDLETNILYNDTPEDLKKIFIRDTELLLEYEALKRGQQKKRKLEFIRRYNERHPLYVPVIKTGSLPQTN